MARYREKSSEDLRWNQIRRRLTRELDTRIADWREEKLNILLSSAWDEFTAALDSGQKLTIEDDLKDWVTQTLERNLVLPLGDGNDETGS